MNVNAEAVKLFIKNELAQLQDSRVTAHINSLLVNPYCELRQWDYGKPDEQFPCWVVLVESNTGIAYCENGFGPRNPWGLLCLEKNKSQSMGMDSGWFPTFLEAYFESAASSLPIWRIFKENASGLREPISNEDSWDNTWEKIMKYRKTDPASRYHCGHSISCT